MVLTRFFVDQPPAHPTCIAPEQGYPSTDTAAKSEADASRAQHTPEPKSGREKNTVKKLNFTEDPTGTIASVLANAALGDDDWVESDEDDADADYSDQAKLDDTPSRPSKGKRWGRRESKSRSTLGSVCLDVLDEEFDHAESVPEESEPTRRGSVLRRWSRRKTGSKVLSFDDHDNDDVETSPDSDETAPASITGATNSDDASPQRRWRGGRRKSGLPKKDQPLEPLASSLAESPEVPVPGAVPEQKSPKSRRRLSSAFSRRKSKTKNKEIEFDDDDDGENDWE